MIAMFDLVMESIDLTSKSFLYTCNFAWIIYIALLVSMIDEIIKMVVWG